MSMQERVIFNKSLRVFLLNVRLFFDCKKSLEASYINIISRVLSPISFINYFYRNQFPLTQKEREVRKKANN